MLNWLKRGAPVGKEIDKADQGESVSNESIALKDRGNIHLGNNELDEAADCYRQAIAINAQYAEAYNNHGYVFQLQGKLDEAIAQYRKALEIKPTLLTAHQNLGFLLLSLGQKEAAEESLRKVIELDPNHAEATQSLGAIAAQRGDHAQAEALLRRAIELQPDHAGAHYILALTLHRSGRLLEAETAYFSVIEREPNHAGAQYALGLLLLALGRLPEGWRHYEYRYHPGMEEPVCKLPSLPYPQWRGESLVGKSLLLFSEQGFGDCIQFVRYAPLLKGAGVVRLAVLCNPALEVLIKTVNGVDEVVAEISATEKLFDYWAFPLSLPLHFNTTLETIPSGFPYVHALTERIDKWRDKLPPGSFKVGLVWKGSTIHMNDANRSLPELSTLAPLWPVPGVIFISLQKGQGEKEAKNPPAVQPLIHLGSEINDFADTAAIVEQLDLVICVDTSIAHLAGAMNKACWVLLPIVRTDWRWMRDREDSPWYPSLRLFRQKQAGQWGEPVERMRQALIGVFSDGNHHVNGKT